ncbi:MAG: 4'-phosphopantetheinyl transferase superfamily protein [Ruminococcus sp.]|nr:4'-phosphopantetheinyl transferase superfamily protein [Ruminococcus sp.]
MINRVYAMDVSVLEDREVYERVYAFVGGERRRKAEFFRFGKDRRLSLGAGYLLLRGASRLGLDAPEIAVGEHGKPYFAGAEGVHFNLSHSGRLAVCAFSDRPVGIDAEELREFDEKLIRQVFTADEERALAAHGCTPALCTRLWTVKESLMKYLGTGMTLDPRDIFADPIEPRLISAAGYDISDLHLTCFEAAGCAVTICSGYERFAEGLEWVKP